MGAVMIPSSSKTADRSGILSKDSVLQGNAGSGDNDGQFHPFGAMHLPKDTAHEVSQRFAGAYACFAQGNFLII